MCRTRSPSEARVVLPDRSAATPEHAGDTAMAQQAQPRHPAPVFARRTVRLARRLLKGTGYALIVALPLFLALATAVAGLVAQGPFAPAPALAAELPAPPAYDPA